MVQLIRPAAVALPDAQAETARGRIAQRVHDFGAVAVPLRIAVLEGRAVGNEERRHVVTVRSKSDVPESDDRRAVVRGRTTGWCGRRLRSLEQWQQVRCGSGLRYRRGID